MNVIHIYLYLMKAPQYDQLSTQCLVTIRNSTTRTSEQRTLAWLQLISPHLCLFGLKHFTFVRCWGAAVVWLWCKTAISWLVKYLINMQHVILWRITDDAGEHIKELNLCVKIIRLAIAIRRVQRNSTEMMKNIWSSCHVIMTFKHHYVCNLFHICGEFKKKNLRAS